MDLSPLQDPSAAVLLVKRLVDSLGQEGAHKALDLALEKFTTLERAALAMKWDFWARPKQLSPQGRWRSWGFLAGRGFGKTRAGSQFVNDEIEAGRAMLVGLSAQDEDNTIGLQVTGPSGLIATSKPWFRPVWEPSNKQLVYPNGARAIVRTPERPDKIRGWEYELSWIIELQSWPKSTREKAFMNFLISTRLGYARIVWDATPQRGHPVLLELLASAEAEPEKHRIVRGGTRENAANLGDGYVSDLVRKYGGTQQGREELEGEMLRESEKAIAKQEWIDAHRRQMPARFVRRGLGVDPAITVSAGSDRTGIVEAGLGVDGQGHVLGDYSGKHEPHVWAKIVLDTYERNGCDIVVVETNKGGKLVTQNLRAAAKERKLEIVLVGKEERPSRVNGSVFVKEVYSKGSKLDRARPLSTAYEAGRISHVFGAALDSLETTLTTWEPTPGSESPDDLDAEVMIMSELLDLTNDAPDPKRGFQGIGELAKVLATFGGGESL